MHKGRGQTARVSLGLMIAAVFVLALVGSAIRTPATGASAEDKINAEVLDATANGQDTSFIVYMADQADLSAAASIKDEDARGLYVYNTLREQAARSQAGLRDQLDAGGVTYKTYWAANMIVAEGDRSLVEDVAARSDVKVIESNKAADALAGEDGPESTDEGNEIAAAEVGLNNVQAPGLWSLGFNGQGIVVANQDTGMRWTHAALKSHYRGWNGTTADHNYNWHDSVHARITSADGGTASGANNSCGYNLVAPCDDQGHGTHTTGTTVGDDAGAGVGTGTNQIGAAPGAKWIGCRNMDAGNGRAATYTECFQFFLAPTNLQNQNADPTKRPDVMNNSWGCPQQGELCAPNVMQTIVENSEAAGIFVEASAGNSGPNCNTVTDPPATYASAFVTGAISGTTNALQSFSSRGTVSVDGSLRMKPDLSAPGASVRSSLRTNDTSYGTMSGTSMAGPHVVGVVALLWSSRPSLKRDIARTKWLLTRSANPNVTVASNAAGCGGIASKPNNHFGWGRIDALAAYNLEPSLKQTIDFPALATKTVGDGDFAAGATASSGLPVSYSASGACSVASGVVHIEGFGFCTVTAAQAGLDVYGIEASAPKPWYPAASVARTFAIQSTFGSNALQSQPNGNQSGKAEAFRLTAPETGTLSSLSIYLTPGSQSTGAVIGLYSSNATLSHPDALLASGTIAAPSNGAWNTATLAQPTSLVAGKTYWIAILSPEGNGAIQYLDECCGAVGNDRSETSKSVHLTALPTKWASGTVFKTDGPLSSYGLIAPVGV